MKSTVAEAIGLQFDPIALLLSDQRPEQARQFAEGKWGCVMFMAAAVLRGECAVFDRSTFGCFGGGTGLGFGDQYQNFPGGKDCFKHFLSTGNQGWETGRQTGEKLKEFMRPEAHHHFMHGERYLKSPELVGTFVDSLPITEVPTEFVILKPLAQVDEQQETPEVITFFGDMDQISALTVLVNFGRGDNQNVIFPWAAGCQSIGIYPLAERDRDKPRAVLGLNDISARLYLKRMLKTDLMSFAVPLALYREIETNLDQSFVGGDTWNSLMQLRQD